MSKEITIDNNKSLESKSIRDDMLVFESRLRGIPGALIGDAACPLKHYFGDGLYIREMFGPAGHLIVTKIHKLAHPYFVMSGEVSVLTEEGYKRVKAPHWGMTPAGTKRTCYIHSDSTWITVHPNEDDKQDLEIIEDRVIVESFDEFAKLTFTNKFREQTKKIIAEEKHGLWSDWTERERELYQSGDWKTFSRSRGYSDSEIEDFQKWLDMKDNGEALGINTLETISDLAVNAALCNIKEDKLGEISKSSYIPNQKVEEV